METLLLIDYKSYVASRKIPRKITDILILIIE